MASNLNGVLPTNSSFPKSLHAGRCSLDGYYCGLALYASLPLQVDLDAGTRIERLIRPYAFLICPSPT